MTVSVIICTRDRAESLAATLSSVTKVDAPDSCTVELLVIDNGSNDNTRTVVESVKSVHGPIHYVFEPKPGLSVARNRALKEASGEIIVFTDDDVRVPIDWLERLTRPLRMGAADAVAGGVVFPPHVIMALKAWPLADRWGWFASTAELNASKPDCMVGANMAFHRRVLREVSAFDERLGAGALGFYEDTLFSQQLIDAGFVVVAALDVQVEHHFDTSRLNAASLKSIANRMGKSRAYVFHHWRHLRSRLAWFHWFTTSLKGCVRASGGATDQITERDLDFEVRRAFIGEYLSIKDQPRLYQRRSPERLG